MLILLQSTASEPAAILSPALGDAFSSTNKTRSKKRRISIRVCLHANLQEE